MTISASTVTAHQAGDCWPPVCPCCAADDLTILCDGCGEPTADPDTCDHGRVSCPDCYETLQCHHCAREAVDE